MSSCCKTHTFAVCALLSTCIVNGLVRFTRVPADVLYVSRGKTARFVWDYTVDNKTIEFEPFSPRWSFYSIENNTPAQIGYDNGFSGWKWVLSKMTCPARLFQPVQKVRKESVATLVIYNVTTADSGVYDCSIILTLGKPLKSRVQLIVTDLSFCLLDLLRFTILKTTDINITEGKNLSIVCSATGSPLPNITWVDRVGVTKVIRSEGIGNVALVIANITRHQSGTYECQAKNNPNERPITTQITVVVKYKPVIDPINSTSSALSFNGNLILLLCLAQGQPVPQIKWYSPQGREILTNTGGMMLTLITKGDKDYGQYKCKATNILGTDEHTINVTQLFSPGPPHVKIGFTKSSSIVISWTVPGDAGGSPVIGYKVEINTKPPQEIITNQNNVVIAGRPNTTYTVKVFARNVVGYGKPSIIVVNITTQKERSSSRKGFTLTASLAGLVGIVLLVTILTVVILAVIFKRKCTYKQGVSRREDNNISSADQDMPIYAQVDKSKKKRPQGEVTYADIAAFTLYEDSSSGLTRPLSYQHTTYADIQELQAKDVTDPIYETVPNCVMNNHV